MRLKTQHSPNAMRIIILVLGICMLAGNISAITFLFPENSSMLNITDLNITFTWDDYALNENNASFLLEVALTEDMADPFQSIEIPYETTIYVVPLFPAMHYATIALQNTTTTIEQAGIMFEILNNTEESEEPEGSNYDFNITVEESSYESGSVVGFSLIANMPMNVSLNITKDGVLQGTTLGPFEITDEIMPLSYAGLGGDLVAGNYELIAFGHGVVKIASFVVIDPIPLAVSINVPSSGIRTKVIDMSAVPNGGTQPYTYYWNFSDGSYATTRDVEHIFFEAKNYTVNLTLTDDEGESVSVSSILEILEETYNLQILLLDEDSVDPLANTLVTLENPSYSSTKSSNNFGFIDYTGLFGEYNLTVHNNSDYFFNTTINMSSNKNIILNVSIPEIEEETNQTDNETDNETEETTATTETSATAAETVTEETSEEEPKTIAVEEHSIEETDPIALLREEKATRIEEMKHDFLLSEENTQLLSDINLQDTFDKAIQKLPTLTSEADIILIVNQLPKQIEMKETKKMTLKGTKKEIKDNLETFFTAANIEEEDKKAYERDLLRAAKYISFNVTLKHLQLTDQLDTVTNYYVMEKELNQDIGLYYLVEIIPKSEVSSTEKFTIVGSYVILNEDPVIRFNSGSYRYLFNEYVNPEKIVTLMVPLVVSERGGSFITGFSIASITGGTGLLYTLLVIVLIGGLIGANILSRQKESKRKALFESFLEICNMVISYIQLEQFDQAEQYHDEVLDVYYTLDEKTQKEIDPVISFIHHKLRLNDIRKKCAFIKEHFVPGVSVDSVSKEYENILAILSHIDPEYQEEARPLIADIDTFIEQQNLLAHSVKEVYT